MNRTPAGALLTGSLLAYGLPQSSPACEGERTVSPIRQGTTINAPRLVRHAATRRHESPADRELFGTPVHSLLGERLGVVYEVTFDPEGNITSIVVGSGAAALGAGDTGPASLRLRRSDDENPLADIPWIPLQPTFSHRAIP